MTPRKRYNLLIAILGGSISVSAILMVCLSISIIFGAEQWQDADIEAIDRTPQAEFEGLERELKDLPPQNDKHVVGQDEHPSMRY